MTAWAVEADVDPEALDSNTFTMEWSPNSGTEQAFPELNRAAYFNLDATTHKIVNGQRPVLDRLCEFGSSERRSEDVTSASPPPADGE